MPKLLVREFVQGLALAFLRADLVVRGHVGLHAISFGAYGFLVDVVFADEGAKMFEVDMLPGAQC